MAQDMIPLFTARELAPALNAKEGAMVERWCEENRMWVERGASQALVKTDDVRALLMVAIRLAQGSHGTRETQVTVPEIDAVRGRV